MSRFRFSLFRLFMAVTVFCSAFAFVKAIGAPWPICPWLIGVPMAMLMLVIEWKDKDAVCSSVMSCAIGFFVAGLLGTGTLDSGPEGGLIVATCGVIIFWLLGLVYRVRRQRIIDSNLDREKDVAKLKQLVPK